MTAEPDFCEFGARTNFSFLEGASQPEEMVVAASALGLAGLGIADRNSVAGVVRAWRQLKVLEEKYKNPESRSDDEKKEGPPLKPVERYQPGARLVFSDNTPDILAYPQDRRGWGNLCRLLSTGNLRAEKGTCTLFLADLLEWGDRIMLAIVPNAATVLEKTGFESLDDCTRRIRERFPKTLHIALSPARDGRDALVFAHLAQLADKHRLPLVATNQPLYHGPDRRPLSDIVTAIREGVPVAKAGFRLAPNAERHMKHGHEMTRLLQRYPEAVANSCKFFSRLSFSLQEISHNYPDESIDGEHPFETLKRFTYEGAAKRYPEGIRGKVLAQINYELDLIGRKDYAAYFLTVYKIVQHARYELKILCQGRGSAANSVICYCLEITEVDPGKSTLLFDRFLSMDRDEPPDIDVDFEHGRREEVIQYIYKTYGIAHAGLTAGVTTYRSRSAGREVAKAFDLAEDVQSAISHAVSGWWTKELTEADARAAGLDISDPTTKNVLHYATTLMGFPRHLTQHVGGFVITRDRLDEVVPIMKTAMPDRYMIEWDKDDLDSVNILKIDILALGMLTCMRKAFAMLQSHYGVTKTLADLGNATHEDEKPVYHMICRADTIGVFQIESRAQMSMLPRLRPRRFYDLVIEVAIVRPGPIQGNMVHPYLKQREAARTPGYRTPFPKEELRPILERTLGVPLFQEQAMQIAITAAEFPPAKADQLRRSMATFKRTGKVNSFRDDMVNGMIRRGYERDFAERCFRQIEGFGEYGFPESHASSFALLVYASSWVKAYYPDVFCAALLNSQPMGFYPAAQLVRDAREHGVEVRPVDINFSNWDTLLEEAAFNRQDIDRRHETMIAVIRTRHAVRLGFHQVTGLSETDMMEKLVAHRGDGYTSIRDLWLRSGLERPAIERLADADAFRSLGLSRRQALWEVRALDGKSAAEKLPLFDLAGHEDLQSEPETKLPTMPAGEEVIEDYRRLSLSLKAHPVSFLRDRLARMAILPSRALLNVQNGRRVTIAGLVLVRQRPGSANGVIFMTLEDETGIANAIVWPATFARYRTIVLGARLVKIRGKLQSQDGVLHVVAEHMEDMTSMLGLLLEPSPVRNPFADNQQGFQDSTQYETIPPKRIARTISADAPAAVMPKGRNFH
ncbi:DNA polymerase-3 subunit alpha/error-prone DNA polymerase [Pararhizobium capsulatum DSM 1112]|uniref:Error-prone DNA polymerase n=1 Tax=Pararhizobium capsulatum DSM 1112 TaxID=1121113 RepID=A0ABU0BJS7_9HYPH|nr:error-prone DNA polymerase [Pararhizobium capsulatum]MDQ0318143.1 DNA polymerase-3 subunit alpha/error-prone DNA polymerase [Pararhizobium capsulatum DSM 1112]